jgi:hypothetical protein
MTLVSDSGLSDDNGFTISEVTAAYQVTTASAVSLSSSPR